MNDSTSDISSVSPDHCRFFTLSVPKEEQLVQSCLHSHLIESDRCQEQMQEHEEDVSLRKKVVFGNLQLEHPVTYKSYNLCKLAAHGKFTTKFSIADLKDICDSLDIETEDFKYHLRHVRWQQQNCISQLFKTYS